MNELNINEQIALGGRLMDVLNLPGWEDVLGFLKQIEEQAKTELLDAKPGERDKVCDLHAQARAARVVHSLLVASIHETINTAKELKEIQHLAGNETL